MLIKKSFKYLLKLNRTQIELCNKIAGCCRFVWNKSLATKKELWLGNKQSISQYTLNNFLVSWKEEYSWLKEAPSQALQQVNKDLNQAYKNFLNHGGFPKFKKKGKYNTFRLPQGIKLLPDLNHKTGLVELPKLGKARFVKSRAIKGTIKNVTLSKSSGKWYISFNCDMVYVEKNNKGKEPIGIDRGVTVFGMQSNGIPIHAKNPLKNHLKKLKKIQKQLSKKKKFSKNWQKVRMKLSRLQEHISNVRKDFLHKTSTTLTKNHGIIVMEDLKTTNMTRSAKGTLDNPGKNIKAKSGLNRSILDQGWNMFNNFVLYKAQWYGSNLILVNPQYTSQTCFHCDHIDSQNRKNEKFLCTNCGHHDNADLNAAKNILAAGLAVSACGEGSLETPMKQEPEKRKVVIAT